MSLYEKLTRQEMEQRRISAIPDLNSSRSLHSIARRYHVSPITVSRWKARLANGNMAEHKAPGRMPKVTFEQAQALWKPGMRPRYLRRAILNTYGVEYSAGHIDRLSAKLRVTAASGAAAPSLVAPGSPLA